MDGLPSLGSPPVRSFGFRLWHVQHAFVRRLEAALLPLGLTHMQFVVLRVADHLAQAGEQPTQARLAVGTATDRMMVSKVLRLLEGKGLVLRPVHPADARAHHVVLTAEGRRLVAQAVPLALQAQAEYFGCLSSGLLEQLDAVLDELLRLDGSPIAAVSCVSGTVAPGTTVPGTTVPGTEGCVPGANPRRAGISAMVRARSPVGEPRERRT